MLCPWPNMSMTTGERGDLMEDRIEREDGRVELDDGRIELDDGWSASRERWGRVQREVESEFAASLKAHRVRIVAALAHGQRAYPLVVKLGGDAAAVAAAKRL